MSYFELPITWFQGFLIPSYKVRSFVKKHEQITNKSFFYWLTICENLEFGSGSVSNRVVRSSYHFMLAKAANALKLSACGFVSSGQEYLLGQWLCCGSYGHQHANTLSRLRPKYNAKFYQTATKGQPKDLSKSNFYNCNLIQRN